jgi:hypothetical protein
MPRSGARARSAPFGPRSGKFWGFIGAWGRFPQGNGGALRAETRRGQPAVHEITTCTRYAREHFKMHSNTLL